MKEKIGINLVLYVIDGNENKPNYDLKHSFSKLKQGSFDKAMSIKELSRSQKGDDDMKRFRTTGDCNSDQNSSNTSINDSEKCIRDSIFKSIKKIEHLDSLYEEQNEDLENINERIKILKKDRFFDFQIKRQSNDEFLNEAMKRVEELQSINKNLNTLLDESNSERNEVYHINIHSKLSEQVQNLGDKLDEVTKETDETRFAFISYKEKVASTHELLEDRESEILDLKEQLEETKNLYNSKATSKCRYSKDINVLKKVRLFDKHTSDKRIGRN
ncbi:hypothetical protein MXB_4220 [Myxobolus squamalis]|nr:hypothetical protein MXB_4220 [Myxobolus squamalis]